jgi:integrase
LTISHEKGIYPEEVRWISTTHKQGHKLPEELITREEVEKMIDCAEHIRDKTLIALLYESGCRIGELTSIRIKNVSFDDYGCILVVNGKTGMRRVRIIEYSSFISRLLADHPDKDDPESPLWVNIGTTKLIAKSKLKKTKYEWHYAMSYHGIAKVIKNVAKRAGIKKRIHPHLFRHSRATELSKKLTEAQMKQIFGWTQGSKMASVYVHLSGRDVDDALLKINGLEDRREKLVEPKPKKCPRCNEINPHNFKYCGNCSMALDIKAAVEADKKKKVAMEALGGLFEGKNMDSALENFVREKIESYFKEKGFNHKQSS